MDTIQFYGPESDLIRQVSIIADHLEYETYIVGGYVRDRILERPSKDMDFVCVGDGTKLAIEVAKAVGREGGLTIYKRFGTAMFSYNGFELEFVGARKESYSRDSRKPSVEPGTLEDDQRRRDFTINALAISVNRQSFGRLIDPFDGVTDLNDKIIRTPLIPEETFSDDPLRMMRAVRFACQLNFEIDPITYSGIKSSAVRLKIVSMERINTELNKIILSDFPARGFKLMSETGLLEIFLPEFEALRGVEYKNGRGHKDNFYHTLQVLENLCPYSDDLWLRWAALLHDIAKPATKKYYEETGWTFHGHEHVGSRMVPKIFKRLKLPLDHKMKYVQKLVLLHLRPISLTNENITDSAVRRLLFDAGDDIDDLMTLCKADITSKNKGKVARYLSNYDMVYEKLRQVEEKDRLRNWQPPISGEIIMKSFNIKPSKQVGIIKDSIREAILDGVIPNEYEAAYQYMLTQGEKLGLKTV